MSTRCGWCITDDHGNCVVIVEMGRPRDNQKPLRPRDAKKPVSITIWRCGCDCLTAVDTKCLDCQRVGVEVVENRCPDKDECKRWRGKVKRPPVREVRV